MLTEKILLNDILHLSKEELAETKIRLICNEDEKDVLEIYKKEPDVITDIWFMYKKENQNNLFHEGNLALCFVKMNNSKNDWLFVSAKKILKNLGKKDDAINYSEELIDKYQKFFGRLIVTYKKKQGEQCQSYWADNKNHFIEKLEVLKILSESERI